jgi:hypothetical protein
MPARSRPCTRTVGRCDRMCAPAPARPARWLASRKQADDGHLLPAVRRWDLHVAGSVRPEATCAGRQAPASALLTLRCVDDSSVSPRDVRARHIRPGQSLYDAPAPRNRVRRSALEARRATRYGFRHCKFLRARRYRDRSRVAPSALTRDRAMVADADSRVDAYMCHETNQTSGARQERSHRL